MYENQWEFWYFEYRITFSYRFKNLIFLFISWAFYPLANILYILIHNFNDIFAKSVYNNNISSDNSKYVAIMARSFMTSVYELYSAYMQGL